MAYYDALEHNRLPIARGIALDAEDRLRAELIQDVMCRGRVDFAAVERRFDIRFRERFEPEFAQLRALAADGLVSLDDRGVTVTPRGRLLLRVVAMAFDATLRRSVTPVRAFSRVI
jgi:oxygen-independent coproporphyrinogen-3 oxidase